MGQFQDLLRTLKEIGDSYQVLSSVAIRYIDQPQVGAAIVRYEINLEVFFVSEDHKRIQVIPMVLLDQFMV